MQIGTLKVNAGLPLVMGIINATPDSFTDGGSLFDDNRLDLNLVWRRAERMVAAGASILDVGGESTRPGATPVSSQQELGRVIPIIEGLRRRFDVPVSVDTSRAEVIREAAAAGVALINDVRALRGDGALRAAAETSLPVCLMHMQGVPCSMQAQPTYADVVSQVEHFLLERVAACEAVGIARQRLLLDPGFGFGKTLAHNLALFKALPQLVATGFPVLIGVSKKSMVAAILGHTDDKSVDDRVVGSVVLAVFAAQKGVSVIRVHDVAETVDALNVLMAV